MLASNGREGGNKQEGIKDVVHRTRDQCLQSQQVKQAASPLFVLLWWKAGVNTARLEVHC